MKTTRTIQKPLMLNFVQPREAETIDAVDYNLYYDPIKQIAYYLGGGGKGGKNTTSQKGHRQTKNRVGPDTYSYDNDAPVMTDD